MNAALITYRYAGVSSASPYFAVKPVVVEWTIDTTTVGVSQGVGNVRYDLAVVSGFYQYGADVFPFVLTGNRNSVTMRTDALDINFGTTFSAMNLGISTDGISRGGVTPYNAAFALFDYDSPRDTVLSLDLDQPLNTALPRTSGGMDAMSFGLGAFNGSVSSTITSGGGNISIVPEPSAILALALTPLLVLSRRRRLV